MKVSIRNLTRNFRDADRDLAIISQLDFDFPEGASIAIVGRSGVGKSTLLHLLGGLDRPTSGSVWHAGVELSSLGSEDLSAHRGTHVGFIFQSFHLLAEFTALENVAMPLLISGEMESIAMQKANTVLEQLGLSDRTDHVPGQLSGGEQQRVAIARAIVAAPELILADEPTGNLDLNTAQEIQGLLLSTNKRLNNTLIIVTHSLELARLTDLVLEMLPGGKLKQIN